MTRDAQLIIGCHTPCYVKSGGLLEYTLGADTGSPKQVVTDVGKAAAEESTLDAPMAAGRQDRLSLDSELLNGFQLGGLKVTVGKNIRVDGVLVLASGSEVTLFVSDVAIDVDIIAHGDSLQVDSVSA